MIGRFEVRRDDEAPAAHGVWDEVANGWRARDLTEEQAHQVAAELELQYDAHGPRAPERVRRVQPPCPVQRAVWQAGGVLEAWVRQDGQWYGRVLDAHGRISWVPSAELRPDVPVAPTE